MGDYYVYILYSEKCDKYYVGHTFDLDRRLLEHNCGKGGAFSSSCMPWALVYMELATDRSAAMKREREIKGKKSRRYIEALVSGARASR
jgi:putative endonuclease